MTSLGSSDPGGALAPDPAQVARLRERLRGQGRLVAMRRLGVLQVATGGCGACAREAAALDDVAGGLAGHGLERVDTPRHAATLLATGPAIRNAVAALVRTFEAMPAPAFVVAIGDCAATGGPFGATDSYAMRAGGLAGIIPVDLVVRGDPPPPAAILVALATLRAAACT